LDEDALDLDIHWGEHMTQAEVGYKTSAADVDRRNGVVMEELSQVYYIARRSRERLPQCVQLEDLVNTGVIGLLEAYRHFDSAKKVQFNTFAKFRIRGAILDSLRAADWASRSLRRKGREISEATGRLEAKLGRHPDESEIAQEMNLKTDHLQKLLAQLDGLHLSGQHIAASVDDTGPLDVIESAPSRDDPDPFDLCLQGEMNVYLAAAISKLTEREQLMISLHYRKEFTMKETAKAMGVGISRVSQMRQATITKLRASLAHIHERPTAKMRVGTQHHEHPCPEQIMKASRQVREPAAGTRNSLKIAAL
jgi:RNA polymerase sigma factor FliA